MALYQQFSRNPSQPMPHALPTTTAAPCQSHPCQSHPHQSHYWADYTSAELAALDKTRAIAVLPVVAIEQHGPHLPLSVDTALANGMIAACLPHLPAHAPILFLPTQAVGYSPEHTAFAGTLTLQAPTVIQLWTELAQCVAAAGVRKLLIFNTHGGNVGLLDVVARDLRARLGMLVYSSSWFNLPLGEAYAAFSAQEQRFGIHAGEIETSLMLALHPATVREHALQNFTSTAQHRAAHFATLGNGRSAKLAWQMQDYNPQGATGNAAAATAAKGQALLAATGQALAQLLAEIDQLPADTLHPHTS